MNALHLGVLMAVRKLFVVAVLVLVTAGLTWADGLDRGKGGRAAGGGGFKPKVPGKSGATGGALLRERRNRKKRLRDLGAATSSTPSVARATPAAARPNPRGRPTPPQAATRDTSLVHLHHGSVRMVADLARVDLTLEVKNTGADVLEWQRTYAIDPRAEVIGAVLKRVNEAPIRARTLTTEDALRVYARIRTPPPRRTPGGPNRDPLLVSRERNDRLRIQIWPINAQETVRVELTFVTPLRGQGARRTYVDVMGGPAKPTDGKKAPRLSRPEQGNAPGRRPPAMVDHKADWLMQPGELILSAAPAEGMTLSGEAGGKLHFTGIAATTADAPAPRVAFLSKSRTPEALLVGNGSLQGRIAAWRFDPKQYVASKGFTFHDGLTIKLSALKGSTRRIAPSAIAASGEPVPVTALVFQRTAADIGYHVDVLDRNDRIIVSYDEKLPLRREKLDADLQGAVSGWHRAQLVRRVFRWAGSNAKELSAARRYAVDMGVLMAGSSAIAIPISEKPRLTPELRRLYDTDGVPLGAQRHEADLKAPPRKSMK